MVQIKNKTNSISEELQNKLNTGIILNHIYHKRVYQN